MVLRRYTPPTCTLEITANSSRLSWWATRRVRQSLQFELHFDAPQLPEEQRVTVRGDRAQLEALRDAVNTYVHNFLCESFDRMDALLPKWQESDRESSDDENAPVASPQHEERDREENSRDRSGTLAQEPNFPGAYRSPQASATAAPFAEIAEEESVEQRHAQTMLVPNVEASDPDSFGIYLQPRGLLGHDLFLGAIATEESGPVAYLSVSQLFDLATALDRYEADENALSTRSSWFKQPAAWAKTAAIVLVSVGVTASAIELLNRNTALKTAAPPANQQVSKNTQPPQIAAQQPKNAQPQPVAIAPAPTPTLAVPAPPVEILPPPPIAQTTALPKLPKILGDSSVPPNPDAQQLPESAIAASPPPIPAPLTNSIPPAPQGNNAPIAPNQAPTVYIPPAPPTIVPSIPPSPNSQPPVIAISPNGLPDRVRSDNPPEVPVLMKPRAEAEVTPAPSLPPVGSLPEITPAPPLPSVTGTPEITPAPSVAAKSPESTASQAVPPVEPNAEPAPGLPAIEGLPDSKPSADEAPTTARSQLPTLNQPANIEIPAPVEEASGAIAGVTPQLTEAQNYFQQRWKPPTELNKPLEYTLALNPDGSIQQIIPRGETSEKYVDRTGMPLMNEPFVSRLSEGRALKIRVVLRSDGKVQTFEEP